MNGFLSLVSRLLLSSVVLFFLDPAALARGDENGGPGIFLQGGLITSLVADPSGGATLFAGTGRGLYRTVDGGATWTRESSALGDRSILSIALDPATPARVLAGTESAGLFRSPDGGSAWTPASAALPARYVGAIVVDPTRPGVVYAGSEAGRVYRSEDSGATWVELTRPVDDLAITCITVDPSAPESLYVGTNSAGLFRSRDGGQIGRAHV